jgi:hypothetical protein
MMERDLVVANYSPDGTMLLILSVSGPQPMVDGIARSCATVVPGS